MRRFAVCMLLVGMLWTAQPIAAQAGFGLSWNTVAGGGAAATSGGTYGLGGTIGQPEAGAVTGGQYGFRAGFWSGVIGAASPGGCRLDVDGSGPPPDLATDIVYVARRLLHLPPVPASFRALDPTIPSDVVIGAAIDGLGSALDVDGDGDIDLATDIVYIARRLLHLPPVPASFRLLDPTIPADAVIAANVDALCP